MSNLTKTLLLTNKVRIESNNWLYDSILIRFGLKWKLTGLCCLWYVLENQVRGIDDDEAKFLSECDAARLQKEREIRLEEKKEIEEIKISIFYFQNFSNQSINIDKNLLSIMYLGLIKRHSNFEIFNSLNFYVYDLPNFFMN